jgi:predicted dehydrogenase
VDTVNFAVVGSTGVIGRVHVEAINRLDNANLVGVAAVRPAPLVKQAEELGVRAYTSLDELLDDPTVDAIVIATPHPSHPSITLKAVEAGKHVLTEKPMAVTVSQAESMVKAARSAGVTLGVLYQNRFKPECQKARGLVEEGALGEIYRTLTVHGTIRSQDYYARRPWRGTWDQEGGGVLINQSIHSLDLLQWLGGMPRAVYGLVSTLKHRIEVEDFASALLEYDNGGHGIVHCNTVQSPNEIRLEIWGERGRMIVCDGRLTLYRLEVPIDEFINDDKSPTFTSPPGREETFRFKSAPNPYAATIQDFANAIIQGIDPAIPGEEGVRSQELSAAITLSGCRDEKVYLPLDRQANDDLVEEMRRLRRLPSHTSLT